MIAALKNRSVQTILVIAIYSTLAGFLPEEVHKLLYTISLFIKDVLVLIMPVTVFAFIAYTISSFQRKAIIFVLILIGFEFLSNYTSVWYAIGAASMVSTKFAGFEIMKLDSNFGALWRLPFSQPWWWGADKGSIFGVLLGCFVAYRPETPIKPALEILKITMEFILTKIFARFIPVFILGFIAQIYKTGMLDMMIAHYSILILYLVGFLAAYLFLIYFIGANFRIRLMFTHMKNLMPAYFIALTSGCSLSTMPWTIKGASLNLKDPEFAKAIIPATTNIQQIGDCIMNTFLCYLIYNHFYGHAPDNNTLLVFSLVFVIARFATAAVIGGAIFIMLPIYRTYLDFSDEMIAIILAMNAILDPIVTSSNVFANGGLAKIFESVWGRVHRKKIQ